MSAAPFADPRRAPTQVTVRLVDARAPGVSALVVVPRPLAPEVILSEGRFWRRIGRADQPMADFRRVDGWAAPDLGPGDD